MLYYLVGLNKFMANNYRDIIKKAYAAFNSRNINAVLSVMDKDVRWPNGWEGGFVDGHDEVKNYWQRQWKEINPHVTPVTITESEPGKIKVEVLQVVKDIQGNLLVDGMVTHLYTIENGLIKSMEIIAANG